MPKHYGPKYEKQRKKQKDLQKQILEVLRKNNGRYNYDGLYVLFDLHHTGEAGPAIQDLLTWNIVKLVGAKDLELTEHGRKMLDNQEYWR
jgi:hypothetical protein